MDDYNGYFQCQECGKNFKSQGFLSRHMKTVHNKEIKAFICDFCGKTFLRKEFLKTHLQRHARTVLTCNICMKSYTSKSIFRRHLTGHLEKHYCDECGASFNAKHLLKNHIASKHKQEFIYNCDFCSRTFTSKASKANHHQIVHKNRKNEFIFTCKECNIPFETKEDLRIHSFIHFNGEIVTCHICDQIFKSNRFLNIHLSKHESEKRYECEECHQKFTFLSGLKKHIRLNRCKGKSEEQIDEIEVKTLAVTQLKEISSNSKLIDKRYKTEIVGNKNSRPHLNYNCDKCGEVLKFRKNLKKHMKEKHLNSFYNCNSCPQSFRSKTKLISHSLEVHSIKMRVVVENFSCEICNMKFDAKSIYESHRATHFDERPEKCGICNDSFKNIGNLNRHMKYVHAENRDEICEICSKSFKNQMALKSHKNTVHADLKVYVNCLYCNKIFMEKCLKSHIINSHTEIGKIKKFTCEICKKSFKTKSLLNRHIASVHEAVNRGILYNCDECTFTSTRLRELRDHQLENHFNAPIHVCECGKKFKARHLLLTHKNSHKLKINIKCPFCTKFFKTRGGMNKHVSKIHLNNEDILI